VTNGTVKRMRRNYSASTMQFLRKNRAWDSLLSDNSSGNDKSRESSARDCQSPFADLPDSHFQLRAIFESGWLLFEERWCSEQTSEEEIVTIELHGHDIPLAACW